MNEHTKRRIILMIWLLLSDEKLDLNWSVSSSLQQNLKFASLIQHQPEHEHVIHSSALHLPSGHVNIHVHGHLLNTLKQIQHADGKISQTGKCLAASAGKHAGHWDTERYK